MSSISLDLEDKKKKKGMVKKIKGLEEEVRELKEEIKSLSNQKFPNLRLLLSSIYIRDVDIIA